MLLNRYIVESQIRECALDKTRKKIWVPTLTLILTSFVTLMMLFDTPEPRL